jgi:diguanylate cyclase
LPPNTLVFLLGLAVGTGLLVVGLMLGYWFGKKSAPDIVDRQQFLMFLRNLSTWTSEFAGDVSKYQIELDGISQRVNSKDTAPRAEVSGLLSEIMNANQLLQKRLDEAEQRLESQTQQISSYLTEARTDGLTNLLNRRAFDKATDELFGAWVGKQQRFALGLVDIDHFKQINDTYGHPAGDAVLKHIARIMQTELRDALCVARYGGEEFGVLALMSSEQLAGALDKMRIEVGRLAVVHEGKKIAVTLSAGASAILQDEKIGKLVRRADEALYAAKSGGRNRVCVHDGRNPVVFSRVASAASEAMATALDPDEKRAAEERVQERLKRIVEEESRRHSNTLQ